MRYVVWVSGPDGERWKAVQGPTGLGTAVVTCEHFRRRGWRVRILREGIDPA